MYKLKKYILISIFTIVSVSSFSQNNLQNKYLELSQQQLQNALSKKGNQLYTVADVIDSVYHWGWDTLNPVSPKLFKCMR